MDNSISGDVGIDRGVIRVAIPRAFGLGFLAPLFNEYSSKRPGLRFDIDVNDDFVNIEEGGYDFAIRIGKSDDPRLKATLLVPVIYKIAASPAFWANTGRPKTPDDMAGLPALAYRMGIESATWRYTSPDGSAGTVRLKPRYVSNNGAFLVKAAIEGLGIILEPTFVCGEALEKKRLIPALETYTWYENYAQLVQVEHRPMSRCAEAFADYLSKRAEAIFAQGAS